MSVKNLGDILLDKGIIDRSNLNKALELQKRRLGEILIQEKMVDPLLISQALKEQAQSFNPTTILNQSKIEVSLKTLLAILDQGQNSSIDIPTKEQIFSEILKPVSVLESWVNSLVQDLSLRLNKSVNLKLALDPVFVDAHTLNELKQLIVHLIRNALFHGVEESSNLRQQQGKHPIANLTLKITKNDPTITLTVEDDGCGIDTLKLYQQAQAKNIALKNYDQMTPNEKINLIFIPGISTASDQKNSLIAGFGMGLEIIESSMLKLGGIVQIESQLGIGTKFIFQIRPFLYSSRIVCCKEDNLIFGFAEDCLVKCFQESELSKSKLEKKSFNHFFSKTQPSQLNSQDRGKIYFELKNPEHSQSNYFFTQQCLGTFDLIVKRCDTILPEFANKKFGLAKLPNGSDVMIFNF